MKKLVKALNNNLLRINKVKYNQRMSKKEIELRKARAKLAILEIRNNSKEMKKIEKMLNL